MCRFGFFEVHQNWSGFLGEVFFGQLHLDINFSDFKRFASPQKRIRQRENHTFSNGNSTCPDSKPALKGGFLFIFGVKKICAAQPENHDFWDTFGVLELSAKLLPKLSPSRDFCGKKARLFLDNENSRLFKGQLRQQVDHKLLNDYNLIESIHGCFRK